MSKLWSGIRQILIILALAAISYKLGHAIGGYGVSFFLWGWGIFFASIIAVMWIGTRYKGNTRVERLLDAVAVISLLGYVLFAITDSKSFNNTVYAGLMCLAAPVALFLAFQFARLVMRGNASSQPMSVAMKQNLRRHGAGKELGRDG